MAYCDCPCDELVQVTPPSAWSMALPYVAQALVAAIVGINMGGRCDDCAAAARAARRLLPSLPMAVGALPPSCILFFARYL